MPSTPDAEGERPAAGADSFMLHGATGVVAVERGSGGGPAAFSMASVPPVWGEPPPSEVSKMAKGSVGTTEGGLGRAYLEACGRSGATSSEE